MKPPFIITVDGPAGTGKSTAARMLAKRLGFAFLDTGAMYRAVGWKCLQTGIPLESRQEVQSIAAAIRFSIQDATILINGNDLGQDIRTGEVSLASSQVAAYEEVRKTLVAQQRLLAGEQSLVSEGRDQGTVVFPDAVCKFFLTASPEVRAQRRYDEQKENEEISFAQILTEQQLRDEQDQNRSVAPLRPAENASVIDTSELTLDEVVDLLQKKFQTIIG